MHTITANVEAKLIKITTSQVVMIGTVKECRKYKRAHFDRFTKIFVGSMSVRG